MIGEDMGKKDNSNEEKHRGKGNKGCQLPIFYFIRNRRSG
jgi:hypothetical protein